MKKTNRIIILFILLLIISFLIGYSAAKNELKSVNQNINNISINTQETKDKINLNKANKNTLNFYIKGVAFCCTAQINKFYIAEDEVGIEAA